MAFRDWFGCCGKRPNTEDIVEILQERGGYERVAAQHGLPNLELEEKRSCATTGALLGKMIQGDIQGIVEKDATFGHITKALQARSAVVVNLKPDHFFGVFPTENRTKIVLIQSYQKIYTVDEWLNARNGGEMLYKTFIDDLTAILAGSDPEAAARLFSRGQIDDDEIKKQFAVTASIAGLWVIGSFKWKTVK